MFSIRAKSGLKWGGIGKIDSKLKPNSLKDLKDHRQKKPTFRESQISNIVDAIYQERKYLMQL